MGALRSMLELCGAGITRTSLEAQNWIKMCPAGGRGGWQQHPPAGGDGQRHPKERPAFLLPHCQRERGPPFPCGPGRPAVALCSAQEEGESSPSAQDTGEKLLSFSHKLSLQERHLRKFVSALEVLSVAPGLSHCAVQRGEEKLEQSRLYGFLWFWTVKTDPAHPVMITEFEYRNYLSWKNESQKNDPASTLHYNPFTEGVILRVQAVSGCSWWCIFVSCTVWILLAGTNIFWDAERWYFSPKCSIFHFVLCCQREKKNKSQWLDSVWLITTKKQKD